MPGSDAGDVRNSAVPQEREVDTIPWILPSPGAVRSHASAGTMTQLSDTARTINAMSHTQLRAPLHTADMHTPSFIFSLADSMA